MTRLAFRERAMAGALTTLIPLQTKEMETP